MQWIRGLLISGTPADFWRDHQPDIQQQNSNKLQQSSSCHHSHSQQHHYQPQQQQQESQFHQEPVQHKANVQQQHQQQRTTIESTMNLPRDPRDASQQQAATTIPSTGAIQHLAAASEPVGCASGLSLPQSSEDSEPDSRVQVAPACRPKHWLGLNPLFHTHALQGYRPSPQDSRAETASIGSSGVVHSQPEASFTPVQQSCVQLPALDSLPTWGPCTDEEPVMLGMPRQALPCTGVTPTDACDAQGVADLQRGTDTQRGSDAWSADAQVAAHAQGMQGAALGGADSMYGYLDQLPQELVACRRVLQYCYVLEYYLQGSANQAR